MDATLKLVLLAINPQVAKLGLVGPVLAELDAPAGLFVVSRSGIERGALLVGEDGVHLGCLLRVAVALKAGILACRKRQGTPK